MINLTLAKCQGISDADLMQIQLLHRERDLLLVAMRELDPYKVVALGYYGDLMQILESELQRLWGFTTDASYTRFWLLPHCTCPRMDNEDRIWANAGVIISGACPVHGHTLTEGDADAM